MPISVSAASPGRRSIKLDIELLFEVADLHRERRLGDRAGLGGAAKMPMLGKGFEITQLAQSDHFVDK